MANLLVQPKKIFFGENALAEAMDSICLLGKKALIVTDDLMVSLGHIANLEKSLKENGVDAAVYHDVNGEPNDIMVDKGLAAYNENGCDFLIGIGGGSPLDTAKAIGAMVTNPGKISDYNGKVITNDLPPLVVIPTTAGTGTEVTQNTIITDTEKDIKMLLKGAVIMPTIAVDDPALTYSMPKGTTAATGLDALTHAVESYTSRKAFEQTDMYAVSAIKRIFKYLPRAYKDGKDYEARNQMSVAALEAGISFSNSSVTIVHGMSRPIGALFHVPHGISNAMLLKTCLEFALDGAYEKFGQLGREIGVAAAGDSDKEAAEKFLGAIEDICNVCEIPTLEKYGINKEEFFSRIDKMATDAIASGSPANTIKEVTKDDVMEIYKKLWD